MIGKLAVYCGSSAGSDPAFVAAAHELGAALAECGVGVVYGGGKAGLMGAVADSALAAGGEVIGVMPQALVDRELAHQGLTRLELVVSMHARKARMTALCDGFVVLPGGIGTLDELFEALSWAQLGFHDKAVVLLDTAGFWTPLTGFLDGVGASGFIHTAQRLRLAAVPDVAGLLAAFGL